MHLESRITWDKLAIELELLNTEDPLSLIQLLMGLNTMLRPEDSPESGLRQINFMAYELMAKCEGFTEAERFQILNQYFFAEKGFQVFDDRLHELTEGVLLLKPVLQSRRGSSLIVALIYLHLASHLDLPAHLIQLRRHFLIKWVRSGHSSYVDLTCEGQILAEAQLVELISRQSRLGEPSQDLESLASTPPGTLGPLAILPQRKIFLMYAYELIRIFERNDEDRLMLIMYNSVLKVEPTNTKLLGSRALLRMKRGEFKESLSDFKRLFSFIDRAKAPYEVQIAYKDLMGKMAATKSPSGEILH